MERSERYVPIDLTLRSQHIQYLEYIAERDEIPLSRALGTLIERKMSVASPAASRAPRKVDKHVTVLSSHLAWLDRLAARLGIQRSDAVRRLIDEALTKDVTL